MEFKLQVHELNDQYTVEIKSLDPVSGFEMSATSAVSPVKALEGILHKAESFYNSSLCKDGVEFENKHQVAVIKYLVEGK